MLSRRSRSSIRFITPTHQSFEAVHPQTNEILEPVLIDDAVAAIYLSHK